MRKGPLPSSPAPISNTTCEEAKMLIGAAERTPSGAPRALLALLKLLEESTASAYGSGGGAAWATSTAHSKAAPANRVPNNVCCKTCCVDGLNTFRTPIWRIEPWCFYSLIYNGDGPPGQLRPHNVLEA